MSSVCAPAHPRAGGENPSMIAFTVGAAGSSPRGRGKRVAHGSTSGSFRLIPARAGKTRDFLSDHVVETAHPRAGGENWRVSSTRSSVRGSSPRGRGKRQEDVAVQDLEGLIPARAGKTHPHGYRRAPTPAHPRAGGENGGRPGSGDLQAGSSPRGRGKRPVPGLQGGHARLIPARAGKTGRRTWTRAPRAAHPRAGGENSPPLLLC